MLDTAAFTVAQNNNLTLHVPCGKVPDYETAVLWDRFQNITDDFPQLALRANDAALGSVAVTTDATYDNDSTAVIEATPAAGCFFAG